MSNTLSPWARIAIGAACVAGGTLPVLAAFDVGPLHRGDINGPPWLGIAAGGVFILGGIALLVGERGHKGPLAYAVFALVMGAFAAIANWIAFGPGPRECSIAIAGFLFDSASYANEIACRAGFGIGAGVIDACILWMIAAALRKLTGAGPVPAAIEKAGLALFLIALAPILVPLFAWLIGRSLVEAFFTWRKTGQWPRNESFIARMKQKRAAKS
jgi:hypothetical protein